MVRTAEFSKAKDLRVHAIRHGQDTGASTPHEYRDLAQDIIATPERVFSGYFAPGAGDPFVNTVFTRGNLIVRVATRANHIATLHRAKLVKDGPAVCLGEYLEGSKDGRNLVELANR